MPEQVWYRSLYWRIALGFVALLATLLLVQGTVFLWMTGRMTDFFPSRSSAQLASTVAADVAAALTEDPDLDLTTFVRGRYTGAGRSFATNTSELPPKIGCNGFSVGKSVESVSPMT